MQCLLVSIEDLEDVGGVSRFINGEGDKVREAILGFTANVPVADSGGSREISKAVAQIGSEGVIILDGSCDIVGSSRGNENRVGYQGFLKRCLTLSHFCKYPGLAAIAANSLSRASFC